MADAFVILLGVNRGSVGQPHFRKKGTVVSIWTEPQWNYMLTRGDMFPGGRGCANGPYIFFRLTNFPHDINKTKHHLVTIDAEGNPFLRFEFDVPAALVALPTAKRDKVLLMADPNHTTSPADVVTVAWADTQGFLIDRGAPSVAEEPV